MRYKPTLVILLGLMMFSVAPAMAQSDTSKISASHLAAAEKLINTTGAIQARFSLIRTEMIKSLSETVHVPEKNKARFVSDVSDFMDKYIVFDSYKQNSVKLYAQTFTEEELNQLVDFYNSPLGRKVLTKLPDLLQKSMLTQQQVLRDHYDELQSIVAKALQE